MSTEATAEMNNNTIIGASPETYLERRPPGVDHSELIAEHHPLQTKPKQHKSFFGKILKSTHQLYDHLGQETWILDRRLKTLDRSNHSDAAVHLLASVVPVTSETKQLYRMIDDYLDRPNASRTSESQVDETISMIELALWHISDVPSVERALFVILAEFYKKRFEQGGNLADIEKAIDRHAQIISRCSNNPIERSNLLASQADLHLSRFKRTGDLMDVDKAIEHYACAVSSMPSDCPKVKSRMLDCLGNAYSTRFGRLRQVTDINNAISNHEQAVTLAPNEDPCRFIRLCNLGVSYQSRFKHQGNPVDIQISIDSLGEAMAAAPPGCPEIPTVLSNLANSYLDRYAHSGELADLERAIECHNQAVSLTPDGHPNMPKRLNSLGASYLVRFERLGNLSDSDTAIKYIGRAVSLTPREHPDYPAQLASLGTFHSVRFDRFGNTSDRDAAIDHLGKAISLAPDGHAELFTWLYNLGKALVGRFRRLGRQEDFDQGIRCQVQAVSLIPDGRSDKPLALSNLGNSYLLLSREKDEPEYMAKAIQYQNLAVSLTPEGHPTRPTCLNNLGILYRTRFEVSGTLEHIDRAISCQADAVSLTPEGHPDKPSRLSNLGSSYLRRFDRLHEAEDLEHAVKCLEQAVLAAPEGHPDLPQLLNNLGSSYDLRFLALGAPADIGKAINYLNQALYLTPLQDANMPMCLGNLGGAYLSRYQKLKEQSDIDKAIGYLNQAVHIAGRDADMALRYHKLSLAYQERSEGPFGSIEDIDGAILNLDMARTVLPAGHSLGLLFLFNLGSIWFSRSKKSSEAKDLAKALGCWSKVAAMPIGSARIRLTAAELWASVTAVKDTTRSLVGYVQAMEILQEVAWIGTAAGHRYEDLVTWGGAATEAAAVAITAGNYGLALEWLEQGRSIVWNQILQLRTPFDELAAVDPDLAHRLKDVASQLDQSTSFNHTDRTQLSVNAKSVELEAQQHRRLAERWDNLLLEARDLPGMSNYLRLKRVPELVRAAESSTAVVLNVYPGRCDALIILQGTASVTHVPLPNLSYEMALDVRANLAGSLQHAHVRDRGLRRPVFEEVDNEDKFESVLAMLWDHVVCPILDHLGFLSKDSTDHLPHITWCATGPLASLPIHAAGYYDESPRRVFDYVVSSYTPTLSAMLAPLQPPTEFRGILAVGQANTAGCTPLPGTVAELQAISVQAGNVRHTQLDGEKATREAILAGMESHDWVHMACHGSQNTTDPTKSAFHVHDGTLDLATITRKSMNGASLAFLSACQTATGDEKLPEEAVHLAAGMIVAGYHAVIATMWSIHDSDAPVIAEKVYGSLLKDGVPDVRRTARGLHDAVGYLRNKVGEKEYSRWVPYVHFGI